MPRARKLHDKYFKQAKREGYLARSAYKLIELDDRHRLLRRGARVLDLGCAPGSWLQVVAERVGPGGMVVGIDLKPASPAISPSIATFVGDLTAQTAEALTEPAGGSAYDVVLSDMAPNTTGHGDAFMSVRLCEAILDRLPGVLRPGGHLAMKVFEGETYPGLMDQTRSLFGLVKGFKPNASRDVSRETFVVAKGYRGASRARGDAAPGPGDNGGA